MNQFIGQFAHSIPRAFAVTAFSTVLAFASLASTAAENPAKMSAVVKSSTATLLADATLAKTKKNSNYGSAGKHSDKDSAEARIKYLHDKFAITVAQEDSWNEVAAVMRENAEKITALVKARAENAKTMTAVDDLNSYAEIAGAHEDGTKKLIPAFKSLYNDMSDAQKKTADKEFREHGHGEHHRRHHAAT